MINKIEFERPVCVDLLLGKHPDIYAVESIVKGIHYGADKEKFAIFRSTGAVFCPIKEMPVLASRMADNRIKKEILEIYEDLKDLKRMGVAYAKI